MKFWVHINTHTYIEDNYLNVLKTVFNVVDFYHLNMASWDGDNLTENISLYMSQNVYFYLYKRQQFETIDKNWYDLKS